MRRIVPLLAFLLASCGQPPVNRDTAMPLETVDYVDLDRYLGLWYEIARFPNGFEENCEGVTAEYGRRDDERGYDENYNRTAKKFRREQKPAKQ